MYRVMIVDPLSSGMDRLPETQPAVYLNSGVRPLELFQADQGRVILVSERASVNTGGKPLSNQAGGSTPGIDPGSEIAPYLQLAAILRGQIEAGTLKPGTRLPSIIVLADSYGIARTTAHKALRILVDEGLAVVSRGRGMYVKR